jgi:serine/threonine-protein phosphatase 2B catalytic subunit
LNIYGKVEREQNVIRLNGQVVIIGDIHGQFYDLIGMYDKIPKPPNASMLFLGDYVDRGLYSVEVLIFLYALKV